VISLKEVDKYYQDDCPSRNKNSFWRDVVIKDTVRFSLVVSIAFAFLAFLFRDSSMGGSEILWNVIALAVISGFIAFFVRIKCAISKSKKLKENCVNSCNIPKKGIKMREVMFGIKEKQNG